MHGSRGARMLVALCAALLAPALAAPAQAAFSGDNGRIAFERDGGIWTMNPDGSDPASVVVSGDDPSWSPDGRKIVYEKSGAIYVVDVATSVSTNLTATHPAGARQDPDFLPSGQIVYIEKFLTKQNVYRMEADGSNPTDLTPANADFLFSPASGSTGAIFVFTNVDQDILLLGGANQTNTAFPTSEGYPDVSPSGSLMFTRCCGPVAGLYVGATRIAGGPGDPNGGAGSGPAWSPDGAKIAALLDNGTKLYVMDTSGGARVQLTGAPTGNLFGVGEVDWGPVPSGSPATPPPTGGSGGQTAPPPSPPPSAKPVPAAKPLLKAKPALGGTARVGSVLRCRPARFTGATRVTTSWLRAGKPIKGARRTTYRPTLRDAGKSIACRSTATGAGGTTTSTSKRLVVRR